MAPKTITFRTFTKNMRLSSVKTELLTALWGSSNAFPKKWIPSNVLLRITKQKYFDRRLRELREQEGLDIESSVVNGEYCWRLNSPHIKQKQKRAYLSQAQKTHLFSMFNYKCSVCHKCVNPGIRGLHADHKKPISRGGGNDLSNWQTLCHECNVVKRRMCQDCSLDCSSCYWAFPEKMSGTMMIRLPDDLKSRLDALSLSPQQLYFIISTELNRFTHQEV